MKAATYPLQTLLLSISGWVTRHQADVIAYLIEENRVLKERLDGRALQLTDDQRRRLAAKAKVLGRKAQTHQPRGRSSWCVSLHSAGALRLWPSQTVVAMQLRRGSVSGHHAVHSLSCSLYQTEIIQRESEKDPPQALCSTLTISTPLFCDSHWFIWSSRIGPA